MNNQDSHEEQARSSVPKLTPLSDKIRVAIFIISALIGVLSIVYIISAIIYATGYNNRRLPIQDFLATPVFITNTLVGFIILGTSVIGIYASFPKTPRWLSYRMNHVMAICTGAALFMMITTTFFSIWINATGLLYSAIALLIGVVGLNILLIASCRRIREMDMEDLEPRNVLITTNVGANNHEPATNI